MKSVIHSMENVIQGALDKSYQRSKKRKKLRIFVTQQTKQMFPYSTSKINTMKEFVTKI